MKIIECSAVGARCRYWFVRDPYTVDRSRALFLNELHEAFCLPLILKAKNAAPPLGTDTTPLPLDNRPSEEVCSGADRVLPRDVPRWMDCLPVVSLIVRRLHTLMMSLMGRYSPNVFMNQSEASDSVGRLVRILLGDSWRWALDLVLFLKK